MAVALSAAALYDVEALRGTVDEMKTRQNELVRQLVSVSNASALNSQNIRRLRGALVMLEANILSLGHVSKLEAVVLAVVEEVQQFFSGLDDLLSGRLTLSLVSEEVVSTEFVEFRAAARKQGYDSVFPEAAQVYQLSASFYSRNGSVFILVPVPIIPVKESGEFDLYKFTPLPVLVGRHLLQLSGDSDFLAISKDKSRFVEVSAAMLDSCRHVGHTFLCSFPSVTVTEDFNFCLKDIFLGRSEDLMTSCNVHILRSDFQFRRLNVTAFVAFTNSSLVATLTCGSDVSQFAILGYVVRNLAPGCVLHAGSVTFVAGFSPVVEVNRIVTHLPGSFLDFSNDTEVLSDVDAALSSFEKVDYRAILKGGERLKKFAPWTIGGSSLFMKIAIGFSVSVALVVVLLTCCVCKFRRQLARLLINSIGDYDVSSEASVPRDNRRLEMLSMNDLIRRELAASEDNAAGSDHEARCEVMPRSVSPSVSVSPSATLLRRAARVQELLEREHRRED